MTRGATARRVLVVGGAGAFGQRLIAGLLATTELDVVIAGRDPGRLAAVLARCTQLRGAGKGRITGLMLDARKTNSGALNEAGAFIVIDAAGPFQNLDYRLPRAAIGAGMHYIDLADARDFVAGFGILDAAAKAAGVVALTGASTTPALSNAVLDMLTAGWSRVDTVQIAISPGNRAPRGLSVVRSILSYAGRPVRIFVDGRWCERAGWGMTQRRVMPGLGRRWLSLAETPDLDLVPDRFRVQQEAVFRAGLEISVLHLGLVAASMLVRGGVLRSLAPMAPWFRALALPTEWLGSDRGGMLVEVTGLDGAAKLVKASWSLVAKGGDGPNIPTLPALAILRTLADGRRFSPGASACVGILPLAAIESEFRPFQITCRSSISHAMELP